MNTKRITIFFTALLLALGLGTGLANASENPRGIENPAAVVSIADSTTATKVGEVPVAPANSPGVVGPAAREDVDTAAQSSAGTVVVKAIRECGLGALVGNTTSELSLENVIVFVNAAGKRLAAVAGGPVALITVAAQGCMERVIDAFGGGTGSLSGFGSLGSGSLGSGSTGSLAG
ncbi:hypothetical protein FK531_06970 [Rhodococcus spelaei]|uniref:Uncharacterized protein n=1 Tax=Rhodococcus spelaei TaxID=2546320 RepID=A0A541BLW4_9NOCA|nr:hypothetical protein [Rhodococcus spelaei]TQF73264.1 hypothetical protein FK531_06970 [Rhodococcus spelaei]